MLHAEARLQIDLHRAVAEVVAAAPGHPHTDPQRARRRDRRERSLGDVRAGSWNGTRAATCQSLLPATRWVIERPLDCLPAEMANMFPWWSAATASTVAPSASPTLAFR